MARQHPRPGAEHARKLRDAQKRALALRRADDLEKAGPQDSTVLDFLVGLVERGIAGPYVIGGRTDGHLLVLESNAADSAWVSERLAAVKPQLLRLCKVPVQDGLCLSQYMGDETCDEDDLPF